MEILSGEILRKITGYQHKNKQIKWFESEGITYKLTGKGILWTTDDWLNGKDKFEASNDDGYNEDFLEDAS